MEGQNISDIIESYLKKVLENNKQIDIKRSEMAHQFNCVPSQINYVINTRFTVQRGYVVESKRGGGGYIRIIKVQLSDDIQILALLERAIGNALTEKECIALLQNLFEEQIITKRELSLIATLISDTAFSVDRATAERIRANMMKTFIRRLGYEVKE